MTENDLPAPPLRNHTLTTATSTADLTRHVPHAQGETHPVMGDPMRFIVTAQHTSGAYALAELVFRHGNGAPPLIHHNEAESFYVLDGVFSVTIDGKELRLSKGDFIHIPRGAVRSFTNISPNNADGRVLILHCPGSASAFYIGMGKLPFPPNLNDVADLAKKHGIELVMPKE
jgi:quercetin dioxygenase-like cupin family protein